MCSGAMGKQDVHDHTQQPQEGMNWIKKIVQKPDVTWKQRNVNVNANVCHVSAGSVESRVSFSR